MGPFLESDTKMVALAEQKGSLFCLCTPKLWGARTPGRGACWWETNATAAASGRYFAPPPRRVEHAQSQIFGVAFRNDLVARYQRRISSCSVTRTLENLEPSLGLTKNAWQWESQTKRCHSQTGTILPVSKSPLRI